MAYGRYRRSRKSTGARRSVRRSGGRGASRMAKRSYRRLSTWTGSVNDAEKKYKDGTCTWNSSEEAGGGSPTTMYFRNNTVSWYSTNAIEYSFANQVPGTGSPREANLLTGLDQGTTNYSRIGNKVTPMWMKGRITFTAATVETDMSPGMNGENVAEINVDEPIAYLRTTIRWVVVKDKMINNAETQVTWPDVFELSNAYCGVHSELRLGNLARFQILSDRTFNLDASNPQKTVTWMVPGNKIGPVVYNSGAGKAMVNKGIYVLWSAMSMGTAGTVDAGNGMNFGEPVMSWRWCFTDV